MSPMVLFVCPPVTWSRFADSSRFCPEGTTGLSPGFLTPGTCPKMPRPHKEHGGVTEEFVSGEAGFFMRPAELNGSPSGER